MSALPNAASKSRRDPLTGVSRRQLYIGRAVLAIFWAVGFAAAGGHFTTGTKVLLVVYPAIDIAASLIDARTQRSSGSKSVQSLLLVNAALSAAALIALAIAIGNDTATVLHVFGVWATVSGLIQLTVVVRRRSDLGRQTAMLISGALSAIAGILFNVMATSTNPKLSILAGYAGLGGVLFIVSAVRRS